MINSFSINNAIKFGWTTFKSNWKFWIIVYLIAFALGGPSLGSNKKEDKRLPRSYDNSVYNRGTTNGSKQGILNDIEKKVLGASDYNSVGLSEPSTSPFPAPRRRMTEGSFLTAFWPLLLLLVPYLAVTALGVIVLGLYIVGISFVFKIGYTHLSLDAVRGNTLNFTTLLSDVNFRKALRLLCTYILLTVIVILGLVFFILPGIYFGLKYIFTPYIIIDKNTSIGEALAMSAKITKGNLLKIFGLNIMGALVTLLGLLSFIVGVLPASIVMSLAFAYAYETLSKQQASI